MTCSSGALAELGDALVREAHPLGLAHQLRGQRPASLSSFSISTMFRILRTKNASHLVRSAIFSIGHAPAERLGDGAQPLVGGDRSAPASSSSSFQFSGSRSMRSDLQRADGLHEALLEGAADGHDLAGGLHLGAQRRSPVRNLSKGQRGILTTT